MALGLVLMEPLLILFLKKNPFLFLFLASPHPQDCGASFGGLAQLDRDLVSWESGERDLRERDCE